LADAVENARITANGSELQVAAPKSYALYFRDRVFEEAVRECFGRPLRIRFEIGDAPAAPAPSSKAAPTPASQQAEDNQVLSRALSHPEVQRFREVFPAGEIRKVRNLKES
jgi:hypothetical protein